MRALKVLGFIVLVAYLFLTFGIYRWIRERHGRGGPFPASQAGSLLNPIRQRIMPVERSLDQFAIQPGQTVLEVGPGPGYYTLEVSRMVGPSGKVFCLDVQPGMAVALQERLDDAEILNAQPAVGDAMNLPLADDSVDVAFLVAVLGEVPDRVAALWELRRVLKPGGTLGFTETMTDPDYILQDTLRDLCRAMGFREVEVVGSPVGYTATFTPAE